MITVARKLGTDTTIRVTVGDERGKDEISVLVLRQ